jgi:hypothetical protein
LKDDEAMVFDNAIEAGNKIIANVGKISMFGVARTTHLTRLFTEANKGTKRFYIGKALDLVPGDRIALGPTSFISTTSEDCIITTYDAVTGEVNVVDNLLYHHWGQ